VSSKRLSGELRIRIPARPHPQSLPVTLTAQELAVTAQLLPIIESSVALTLEHCGASSDVGGC